MQFVLKPPGTKRLKLKYDELPSSFAFSFNLRRCTKGGHPAVLRWAMNELNGTPIDISEMCEAAWQVRLTEVRAKA